MSPRSVHRWQCDYCMAENAVMCGDECDVEHCWHCQTRHTIPPYAGETEGDTSMEDKVKAVVVALVAIRNVAALFGLGAVGLGVSMWPYVVPQSITIWQAAAPERSQVFMLVGVALVMPLILAYTGWAYWVFRGKVGEHGYH